MANYYGDADGYLEYCEARGYEVGELSPSPSDGVDQLLLVASEYIDAMYRSQFPGSKTGGRSQVRDWPRTGARDRDCNSIDTTEIPIEVINATYEAAYREQQDPGSLMPDYVAAERVVSETVGSISTTYARSGVMKASDSWPVIGKIDGILAPLLGDTRQSSLFGTSTRI